MKTFDLSTTKHPDAVLILDDAIHGALLHALRKGDFRLSIHHHKDGPRTVRTTAKDGSTSDFSAFLLPSAKKIAHINGDRLDFRFENIEAEFPPRLPPVPADLEPVPEERRPNAPLNDVLEELEDCVMIRVDGVKGQWWGALLSPEDWETVKELQLGGLAGPITPGVDGNGRRTAWITLYDGDAKTKRLLHPLLTDKKKVRFKNGNCLDLRQENINY